MSLKGIKYLRALLESKRNNILTRYKYYDMKESKWTASPVIPEKLKAAYASTLGWCAKSVDTLSDRLTFKEFKNDDFGFNEIFQANNPDIFFDSAIKGALISACDFIYVHPDPSGFPVLDVVDGSNATGIIDPVTGLLTEGYAVIERDDNGCATSELYFTPGQIDNIVKGEHKESTYTFKYSVPTCLLVPIIYRPDATHPLGHSRISKACMSIQDKAKATLTRTDITAEFYSFPQKYILGLSQDADDLDTWKATITSLLRIAKDEDGDKPVVGQFQTSSMEPHVTQLKMYAALFSGETGLTLDDLGFVTDNPSSAEAIKAAHENLRLTARKAQKTFGTGFFNVGYVATCLRDNVAYPRKQFFNVNGVWEPIFEPDAAAVSLIGDGAIKINQAVPNYFGKTNLEVLTGIKAE